MNNRKILKLSAPIIALLGATSANASVTIVSESFGGTGAVLNGTSADLFDAGITAAGGSSSWVSADTFLDDGSVVVSAQNNSAAHLSLGSYINDTKGDSDGIFELTATIAAVTGTGNIWLSMGFSALDSPSTTNHFLNLQGTGTIILRSSGELDMWAGAGNTNSIDGPNDSPADRTLTVSLDLSTYDGVSDFGSVAWLDEAGVEIDSFDYTTDTDFSSIFFSEANGTISTLSNLTLTQVPEPSSMALLGLVTVLFGLRRQRN